MVKNPLAKAGDIRDESSIPGLGRSPRIGNVNLFQYSYLENSGIFSPLGHKRLEMTEVLSMYHYRIPELSW